MSTDQTTPETNFAAENAPIASSEANKLDTPAPLRVDVESNDFMPPEPQVFDFHLSLDEAIAVANTASENITRSWLFSPEDTLDDDVKAAYAALQLTKKINAVLPEDNRMGCVIEKFLPFKGGDLYINALYRIDTEQIGKAIAVCKFSYNSDYVEFRLFDPVRYPNARSLDDCLRDRVPLSEVLSLEEVDKLTEEEKESFSLAIKNAWCNHY